LHTKNKVQPNPYKHAMAIFLADDGSSLVTSRRPHRLGHCYHPRYDGSRGSVHVLIDLALSIHFQLSNSTDSTTPPILALPTGLNLEYLSLNSLSVKVVTGCLQQSLSSQNWTPEKQSKPNRRISQRYTEMFLGRALSALDFTPATRNVPIVRNHAESCGISPRRPSLSLNCECPFA